MTTQHTAVRETAEQEWLGLQRAREELRLDAPAFELALRLGEIPATRKGDGRWRIARQDVDRLRTEEGFPTTLRDRLRVVGSIDGAELIGTNRDRFSRLAKGGLIRPVRWYVNRYRAVVWLYLADDVRRFADEHPELLTGRLPTALREALAEGEDHRARAWRRRRVDEIVRDATDAWDEAAAWAAVLGPELAAQTVPDPYELAYLRKLRRWLPPGTNDAYVPRAAAESLVVADHPDEIAFARFSLAAALDRARIQYPAPRPDDDPAPALPGAAAPQAAPPPTGEPARRRRGWRRLFGGS